MACSPCTKSCHQELPSSQPHLQLSPCPFCETSASIGHGWQAEDQQRWPWGKRSVTLPQIHCQTQLSPSAKLVVSPGKRLWRRTGKARQREEETEGVRSSRGNTKTSRGGKAPFWSRPPSCSPVPDQMDMPDELQPVQSHHWSRGKPWGASSSCREELLCTDHPLSPSMVLEQGRGAGNEGVKLSLGKVGGKIRLYYLSLLLQPAKTMLLSGD